MLTNPSKIFTKDEELIEVGEDILNWLQSYNPPPLSQNVNIVGKKFSEYSLDVSAIDEYQYSPPFETIEQSTVTFFVKNAGENSAKVKLQISPKKNESDYGYTDDSVAVKTIEPGKIITLVPMIFSRYVRLAYISNLGTDLKIIAQMQI
ncbi:DUF6385 domain-containing protein [Clostridium tepidum]|jgi:hypothetical protein|uniref:DUF6385 domain-containing protein n=1 Tax=Clostridium tepidum TaxID=1962263 RepID=A0A1S9I1I0_9CLOT|nr:DUF6385 domain-containing protein [Clostridium tepidum]MCR1934715.1 DUF6385 domain-containing protein [Clostridium tepidum]MDU6878259.1 DUF6385 domain-containing protein [Clostridium botulinum]OOO62222.1 hypothetical protein BS637_08880 [Clostridium tepidum]OOO64167.1 hypothetical protein BS638_11610 [Clostridium tepidum]